jgi:heterodisulfide reductase subunit C
MVIARQLLFLLVVAAAFWLFFRRIRRIRGNILSGKPENLRDRPAERWRNVLLVAFGQRKMFTKPLPAILHLLIYAGFLIINIEGIEFFLDGVTGQHRTIARFLQGIGWTGFYTVTLNLFEFLAVGVILACVLFLIRRNVLRVKRFEGPEMRSWPTLDANLILIFEIILMFAIMSMNAADQILQERGVAGYPQTGRMIFSDLFASPFYRSLDTPALIAVERIAWWLHIIGIFSFAVYVTYSKHLHTFMAFPNTYYARLTPRGMLSPMPEVTREVKAMLGLQGAPESAAEAPGRLGARDVADLSWKSLMDAYTCTECGRCTSVCPANLTGKKLSPRKIMMDTRDRLEEWGEFAASAGPGASDGKYLLDHYISREELFACTTCNACVEACPVLIDPLSIIVQLRRYLAMEESGSPAQWNSMYANLETTFSPWKFSHSDRFNWARELQAEAAGDGSRGGRESEKA